MNLKEKLTADCDAFRNDPKLAKWREGISKLDSQDAENYDKLEKWLCLYAVGIERDVFGLPEAVESKDSYAWSFCRDGWVERQRVQHCWDCDKCYDDSWHCKSCGVCKYWREHACDKCGGWYKTGAVNGNEDGKAIDAEAGQKDTGGIQPRKRPRRLTLPNENTETIITPPKGIEKCACKCIDFCTTKRCPCRKWGGRCKDDCKCKSMTAPGRNNKQTAGLTECVNPFNQLLIPFFGEEHPKVRAHACFTHFLDQKSKKSKDLTPESLEKAMLKSAEDHSSIFRWDEGLKEWRSKLSTLEEGSDERKKHSQRLFRQTLGDYCTDGDDNDVDGGGRWWWPFCSNHWEESYDFEHCWNCGECVQGKNIWHCGVCRKCRWGPWEPCEGCGGISNDLAQSRGQKS